MRTAPLFALLLYALSVPPSQATVRYVAPGGTDVGDCVAAPCATIQYAEDVSQSGDEIEVAAGTYTEFNIMVDLDVTIRGAGPGMTTVQAASVPFSGQNRNVFMILPGATVVIEGMRMRHGDRTDVCGTGASGGYGGGAPTNLGTLTLREVVIARNRATNGGGVCNEGVLTIERSTIQGNRADGNGGGIVNFGTMRVVNTTFSGNQAGGSGGALYSTPDASLVELSFVTMTLNDAEGEGGGIYNASTDADNVQFINTVLSGNLVAGVPDSDCGGAMTSLGPNFIGAPGCTIIGPYLTGGPAGLRPLGLNGGPTPTHLIEATSAALDAGSCLDVSGATVTTDQRGRLRPEGCSCDIGAAEYGPGDHGPIRITMTPVGGAVVLPPSGGSFQFRVTLTNVSTSPQAFDVWTEAETPSGSTLGPLSGPLTATLGAGNTVGPITRTQVVPGVAPPGTFCFRANVAEELVPFPELVPYGTAAFLVEKLPPAVQTKGGSEATAGWTMDGALLPEVEVLLPEAEAGRADVQEARAASMPPLVQAEVHPNPSRSRTTIRFGVPEPGPVTVRLYSVLGREVAVLHEGEATTGWHEVALDAGRLAAGVYLLRLDALGGTEVYRFTVLR